MSITQAIILGIIQGIAEWLPISSSGHLVIAQVFFGLQNSMFFDILLHIATLFVVFIIFRKEIWGIIKVVVKFDFKSEYGRLGLYIILGSIPTGIIGIIFHDTFEKMFSNLWMVAAALFATGILLILTKLRKTGTHDLNSKNVLLIGLVQGVAVIPGISRSGSTISAGILSGVTREKVARFSFLLGIPAILGTSLFEFKDLSINQLMSNNWHAMIIGMLFAAIVGYFALKILLRIIKSDRFYLFGFYCILLSIFLLSTLVIYHIN